MTAFSDQKGSARGVIPAATFSDSSLHLLSFNARMSYCRNPTCGWGGKFLDNPSKESAGDEIPLGPKMSPAARYYLPTSGLIKWHRARINQRRRRMH